MRKVWIGLTAFGIVLAGFWIYIALTEPIHIKVPDATDSRETEMPPIDADSQPIGDTVIGRVNQARYFRYHPETKTIIAEYGFEMLLNPGEGSSRWRVEKPYLIFYQSDYKCRIDAARGTFQVEMMGEQGIPSDAQLDEDVVIHIMPTPGSRMTDTMIYMDDLAFSSERSEFSTNGPVTVESAQIQMEGYGLVLIFNTGIGKVEYLQIKDLDFLQLKGFASSGALEANGSEAVDENHEPGRSRPAGGATAQAPASEPTMLDQEIIESSNNLYQCVIRDNVIIRYGNELILSGADEVDIMNIRFSGNSASNQENSFSQKSEQPALRADASASSQNPGTPAGSAQQQPTDSQASEQDDVVVICDGGMIIQPMQANMAAEEAASDSALTFEMSGTPLKIDRVLSDSDSGLETLAHCGSLYYKPAEDILRLFTNPKQPQILLSTQRSNSRIETSGNVWWDRKARRANIAGPGTVYIGNTQNPAVEASEISFYGVMDLLFAQMPDDMSSATIQTINLTGGMGAILRQNGTLKTLADSAILEFGEENELFEARLNGDVLFESLDAGEPSSQAAAQSAVFYFDNNQVSTADLNGTVHFISASGQMESPNARIEFAPDSNGSMHPKSIQTEGYSVLQALTSETDQPPAKFESRKIDYDMQTGMGLAHGPIRFTFYQPSNSQAGALERWIPVTITADESAEFIANTDRMIRQVVFNKNVVASRILDAARYTQRDEFHGDKMIVDMDKTAAGSADISRVMFTEGRVYGRSTKQQNEEIIFDMRLRCSQMVYNRSTEVILASGPGDIRFNNSNAESSESGDVGLNFQRPCYALFEGFDTIRWELGGRRIAANGDEKTMQLAYVPLLDGQPEKFIYVNTRQLVANYHTNESGKPVIERIYTDRGITYVEKNSDRTKILRELIGHTLNYDAISEAGWLTITGSEAMPAMVNNTRVPVIRYNVNTGRLKTALSSVPGAVNIPK